MSAQLVDIYANASDAGALAVQQASDTITVAQSQGRGGDINLDLNQEGYRNIKFTLDEQTKTYLRVIAAIGMVIRVFIIVWKIFTPSEGGAGGGFFQRIGGWTTMLVFVAGMIMIFPEQAVTLLNLVGRFAWTFLQWAQNGVGGA